MRVILPNTHPEAKKVNAYFDRLWNNEGAEYTLDFDAYGEKSLVKRVLYEVQERAGLSSF